MVTKLSINHLQITVFLQPGLQCILDTNYKVIFSTFLYGGTFVHVHVILVGKLAS